MAREHLLLSSPSRRVLATRIATTTTTTMTTTTTTKVGETDVELANQISPGIISARAAKQPAARRQGRVQDGSVEGKRGEFNSNWWKKKIKSNGA